MNFGSLSLSFRCPDYRHAADATGELYDDGDGDDDVDDVFFAETILSYFATPLSQRCVGLLKEAEVVASLSEYLEVEVLEVVARGTKAR